MQQVAIEATAFARERAPELAHAHLAYTVRLRAGRLQAPRAVREDGEWLVSFGDLDMRTIHAGGAQRLRVSVRNAAGTRGILVTHVTRVQFVVSDTTDRLYYLRLYENALGPETLVEEHGWFLGAEVSPREGLFSSAIARAGAGVLVFNEEEVYRLRNDRHVRWGHLGWQLRLLPSPLLLQAEPLAAAPPEPAAAPPEPAAAPPAPEPAAPEPGAAGAADATAALLANTRDAEQLRAWRCGICLDGMEEDTGGLRALVAAHAPTVNGIHALHVFHRRCLQRWRDQRRECSGLCPTCKEPLQTEPLLGVWVAGRTTLSAPIAMTLAPTAPGAARAALRLGANPYLVDRLARRLVEELKLKELKLTHAVVDGVDEFSVASSEV